MVDKQSLLLLTFILVFSVGAIITFTGALPTIFETNEKVNQAVIQQHEDEGRANQTIVLSKHIDERLEEIQKNLTQYINISSNRSSYGAAERQQIMESILEVSGEHDKVAATHSKIQKELGNLTQEIRDMLEEYGENSIEKFNRIVENQQNILKEHGKLIAEINNTLKSQ